MGMKFGDVCNEIVELCKKRNNYKQKRCELRQRGLSSFSTQDLAEYDNYKHAFHTCLGTLLRSVEKFFFRKAKKDRRKAFIKRFKTDDSTTAECEVKRKAEMHSKIDFWREHCSNEENEFKKKADKRKAEDRLLEVEIQKAKERESRILLLSKLKELKQLRRESLKKMGHTFPEEDDEFFQRLKDVQGESTKVVDTSTPFPSSESLIQTRDIKRFYAQGKDTLKGFLYIRTQWDRYTTRDSTGTRFPLQKAETKALSSREWEEYYIKK